MSFVQESNHLKVAVLGQDKYGKSDFIKSVLALLSNTSEIKELSGLEEQCVKHAGLINETWMLLVDTTNLALDGNDSLIAKSLFATVDSGFDTFVLLLPARAPNEQEHILETFLNIFGNEVLKYTVIVFCHTGHFQNGSDSLKCSLKDFSANVQKILKQPMSKQAIFAFDPRESSPDKLLQKIVTDCKRQKAKRKCYTAQMLQHAGQIETKGYSNFGHSKRKCVIS